MNKHIILVLSAFIFLIGCKSSQKANQTFNEVVLDEIDVVGKKDPYRPSATRKHDLLHTKLNVSFDWENQYLLGEAWLTLTPYFYKTDVVELDAKGMEIKEVALVLNDSLSKPLEYTYDNLKLNISLDKVYKAKEEYTLYIDYVSKPNELETTGDNSAIRDSKGLYFINPLGLEEDKPKQIWTQGEPEDNSVWFPTIDNPNERCTQEIYITTDTGYIAMSNGTLVSDIDNGDGTHTVYWKQDLPHAPYLFMMTVGDFAVVEDEWNGLSVNYFVEKEYENVAQRIFGNTPEMMTYFSDLFKVEFPWDKYWQVCVRDYVSGAMENTSAVIFGEFVQRDERELLDEDYEDIVSHELVHHWFGDLVTCESWANLPLNESFATYGEVLWREYKYGMDEKYRKVYEDMQGYFREASRGKQVNLIRFHHDQPRDMFDSHSYAKGGTILNMLRDYVGDEAFFESLKVYLMDNIYDAVEIHHLRLAFEKVTGEDMNWFFNQWFLSAGHPEITIDYTYTDTSVIVDLKQAHSIGENLVYQLPMVVDVYAGNSYTSEAIVFNEKEQTFEFLTDTKPFLVNVDANKNILGQFTDNKSNEEWMFQYMNGKNFLDRLYAIEALAATGKETEDILNVMRYAMNDSSWYIQEAAIEFYPIKLKDVKAINILKELAGNAEKSQVVAAAILKLSELEEVQFEEVYNKGLQHPSYMVNGAALEALATINSEKALEIAKEWESIENTDVKMGIGQVYAEHGAIDKRLYFENIAANSSSGIDRVYAVYFYSMFLGRMDQQSAIQGLAFIEDYGLTDELSWAKNVAKSSVMRIRNAFDEQIAEKQAELKESGLSKAQKTAVENEMVQLQFVVDRADESLARLNKEE